MSCGQLVNLHARLHVISHGLSFLGYGFNPCPGFSIEEGGLKPLPEGPHKSVKVA